jgi:hypothetical protein
MMRKFLLLVFSTILVTVATVPAAHAFGEDVLACTGQYTFFIKPDPNCPDTYIQKMVPCIAKKVIPVPRRVVHTFPVPIPVKKRIPVIVTETPVGCAKGEGPCVKCFPPCTKRRGIKEVVVPGMRPVPIRGIVPTPICVTRRIMRPQWFKVTETPVPPKPVRKIRKVGPRG